MAARNDNIPNEGERAIREFTINIRETLEMQITVEAESLSDAITKVKQSYRKGDYVLDADCFTGVEFTEAEE